MKSKKKVVINLKNEENSVHENEQSQSPNRRRGVSEEVRRAMIHLREGMTDVQKSYILQREAKILNEAGNFQGAIDVITQAINLNHVLVFFQNRASYYKCLNKWTEAYFDYSFAIRIEPDNGAHFAQRGYCLAKLKHLVLAIEDLSNACEVSIRLFF